MEVKECSGDVNTAIEEEQRVVVPLKDVGITRGDKN